VSLIFLHYAKNMKHMKVDSSDIVSVGYDSDVKILEVIFYGGRTYQYANVPINVYEELMRAPSIGSYFNTHIRDAYPHAKL